ncbi:MAG: 3-oxo-tetronate kinase [Pseudomonadota bacterium]
MTLLGCIADDLTGATDLALTLAKEGMAVVQVNGVPASDSPVPNADALVVALKSRTIPVGDAVEASRQSLDWLRRTGATRFFFKYCSTFDSTDDGNIGPVADALMADLGVATAIACPAFPANGRTIYQGHLFVGDRLLSDSPMRDHPLTPMRDSNLVAVLARQSHADVGLIPFPLVEAGSEAIRAAITPAGDGGSRLFIVDALTDSDLRTIGTAIADHGLVTGGSGVALGLPDAWRKAGLLSGSAEPSRISAPAGPAVILAGSCSKATRAQVAAVKPYLPHFQLDPTRLAQDPGYLDSTEAWLRDRLGDTPILIYSSADPAEVATIQANLGRDQAGGMIENAMGRLAVRAVAAGATRLIVAGGETSGAVMGALNIHDLTIGQEIDAGVCWTKPASGPNLALALKSGNFGSVDFFTKALDLLS